MRVADQGFRLQVLGFRACDLCFRDNGSGFRVEVRWSWAARENCGLPTPKTAKNVFFDRHEHLDLLTLIGEMVRLTSKRDCDWRRKSFGGNLTFEEEGCSMVRSGKYSPPTFMCNFGHDWDQC